MKKSLVLAACIYFIAQMPLKAQNWGTRFIFGSDVAGYTAGWENSSNYSTGILQSTNTGTLGLFGVTFNLWAGYFVSNKVCAGIKIDNAAVDNQVYYANSFYSGLNPLESPVSLFFRYYPFNDSGAVTRIYMEGTAGANVTSAAYGDNGSPAAATENITEFNIDYALGVSITAAKHLSLLFKAGFSYGYLSVLEGSTRNAGSVYGITGQMRLQYNL